MNKVINIYENYKSSNDTLQTVIVIKLKNGKDVFALFDHENDSPYLISNIELIKQFRTLADHIEKDFE